MPSQLHLVWPEREVSEVFFGLNFSHKFNTAESCLYFAEFEPQIKIGDADLKYIHFIDFTFFGDGIIFSTPKQVSISLPDGLECIKLKIVKPGTL